MLSHLPDEVDAGAETIGALLNDAHGWDFCVMNDFTQHPARDSTRRESCEILTSVYAPLLAGARATPVLLQTWAYRTEGRYDSADLGDAAAFTWRVVAGYDTYAEALSAALPPALRPRVAPVGEAFLVVHDERHDLWVELFNSDDKHLAPIGTFLEACVVHCTIFGQPPPPASAIPSDPQSLWAAARRRDEGRVPTVDELRYLWGVAARVVGCTAAERQL
eukprot:1596811-Prymnesium_polylepis.2